ncbi:unnamed protein product [Effrenium voratum]|nr:unnamed protein product [Effrenium voratum]
MPIRGKPQLAASILLLIAGQSASWLSPVLHVQDGKYLTKALKDIPLVKSVRERLHAAWSELPLQVQEAPAYQDLRAFTIARFPGGAHMLPSPSRGLLLRRLCTAFEARSVLEVGTFTGYSALCFAEAGAQVLSIERCKLQAAAAREILTQTLPRRDISQAAVEVRRGFASDVLPELAGSETYDLIHLDAGMKSYMQFLDLALGGELLAESGVVLADNVLFRGMVTNASARVGGRFQRIAESLHSFNVRYLQEDPRTQGVILPHDDGLAVIWPRT